VWRQAASFDGAPCLHGLLQTWVRLSPGLFHCAPVDRYIANWASESRKKRAVSLVLYSLALLERCSQKVASVLAEKGIDSTLARDSASRARST
jgi:hypothetical protein